MRRNQSPKPSFSRILSDLFLSNQKGFSLAEIMVAAGMLGVLSLGVTQIMQNSAKTEKRLSQSVNLISLDAQITQVLSDTVACERTFGVPAPDPSQPLVADSGAPSAVGYQNNIPNAGKAIYAGNNPSSTTPSSWNRVVEVYNSSTGGGTYGTGSNTVYVKSIQYSGYLVNNPTGGPNNSASYNSSSRTLIQGTGGLTDGPHYSGKVVIKVDFRRGNPASYEALGSDQARQQKARNSVSGNFSVPRYYTVTVRTNSSNKIVDCYANSQSLLGVYCRAVDGYLDPATGKCTNIKIRNSNTATDNWAITAATQGSQVPQQSGNALIQGGLNVGGQISDVPPTPGNAYIKGNTQDDGNLYVGQTAQAMTLTTVAPTPTLPSGNIKAAGDILVGRDLEVQKEFRSDLDALFKGRVNIGPLQMDKIGGGNYVLKVTSTDLTKDKVIFNGDNDNDGGTALPLGPNDSVLDVNNALDTNGKVHVNNASHTPFQILEGTNMVFKISDNGSVDFYNGSSGGVRTANISNSGQIEVFDSSGTSPLVTVAQGTSTSSGAYRPIVIKNQPVSPAVLSNFQIPNGSAKGREVPTKEWVKHYVFRDTPQAVIDDVLSQISKYAQHHTLDAIKQSVCLMMNNRWQYNTSNATNGYPAASSCSYTGGVCTCQPTNCSALSNSNNQPCLNMNLRGKLLVNGQINSNSNIYAQGSIFAQNIVQGKDIIGTKIHTANIGSGSVGNYWIYGNRLRSQNDVCIDGRGCYTRFNKQMCPYQQLMVGIAYGKIVCARVGP